MRATAACLALALISGPALTVLAAPASAEDRQLSLKEFLDLMDGRTAHFTLDGEHYGSEAYHPNRRVIWRYTDGQCLEGTWREIADYLCFQYGEVSCWKVFRTPEGEHYATSDDGLTVDFDRLEEGAFDCQGAPLS